MYLYRVVKLYVFHTKYTSEYASHIITLDIKTDEGIDISTSQLNCLELVLCTMLSNGFLTFTVDFALV
jgi:hypothetical protein